MLRASTVASNAVREAVLRVLSESSFKERAVELGRSFARHDVHARFRAVVDELTVARPYAAAGVG